MDRVPTAADPDKAPKGHHGVNHSPADLLNDQVVDRADAVTSWVTEGSATVLIPWADQKRPLHISATTIG